MRDFGSSDEIIVSIDSSVKALGSKGEPSCLSYSFVRLLGFGSGKLAIAVSFNSWP
jgi:hypothetical protein